MSTRSRKRIHSAMEEHAVENINQLKSERNTRSKQQKINNDLSVNEKKRKHYVRYPSEEEITTTETENIDNMAKNTRKSRRHTLKEQNKLDNNSEASIELKAERLTRRTKKYDSKSLVKTVIEEKKKTKKPKIKSNEENIENIFKLESKTNVKKKSNKKRNKKKSNSLIVTDLPERVNKDLNRSYASNDSFHSAAGSPVNNIKSSINNEGASEETLMIRKNKKYVHNNELNTSTEKLNQARKSKSSLERTCHQLNGIARNSLTEELLCDMNKSLSTSTTLINDIESVKNNTFDKGNSTLSLRRSLEVNSKRTSNVKDSCDNIDDINTTFNINNTTKELDASIHKLSARLSSSTDSSSKKDTLTRSSPNNVISFNATFDMDKSNSSDGFKSNEADTNNITYSGSKKRKTSIKNSTYDKIDDMQDINTFESNLQQNTSTMGGKESTIDSFGQNKAENLDSTYDKNSKTKTSICLNATFDKSIVLDSTFDKSLTKDSIDQLNMQPQAKSSLISSDATDNSSSNITDDNSHVSINSEDSKSVNIVNTTPLLIESSMDDSKINTTGNNMDCETTQTTLRRDGTFTEDSTANTCIQENLFIDTKSNTTQTIESEILDEKTSPKKLSSEFKHTPIKDTKITPKQKIGSEITPTTPLKREGTFTKDSPDIMTTKLSTDKTPRRKSLPSPGYTPYPMSKNSLKEKSILNVTRSIESRRSSIADAAPRMTKVMFCSPVNNPSMVTQMKGKVIKSNLKGSNKSFVFDESVSSLTRPARKRSYTQTEEETEPSPSRPRQRTTSAAGRLQERRTKLPNFAALHQKQFQRMESLDDWTRRRGLRAARLCTPPALRAQETPENVSQTVPSSKKIETPKSKQPSAAPGFTKFGFKLNLDVNPFSIPSKNTEVKPKEKKVVLLKRQATLPSLAGATALRREIAKQTIMREKSFTEKKNDHRKETRTVIKGVRTNRRFELQMKMRNINT